MSRVRACVRKRVEESTCVSGLVKRGQRARVRVGWASYAARDGAEQDSMRNAHNKMSGGRLFVPPLSPLEPSSQHAARRSPLPRRRRESSSLVAERALARQRPERTCQWTLTALRSLRGEITLLHTPELTFAQYFTRLWHAWPQLRLVRGAARCADPRDGQRQTWRRECCERCACVCACSAL